MADVRLDREEAEDGDLPDVCMRCGGPVDAFIVKTFQWYPAAAAVSPLLRLALTKRMKVTIPLCRQHRGWFQWGFGPRRITADEITLRGVCTDFLDALDDYRNGRWPGGPRAPAAPRPRRRPAPSGSGSAAWIVLLVAGLIGVPMLACAGLVGVSLLLPRPPRPVFPPPAVGVGAPAPGNAAALAGDVVALVGVAPDAGFPGGMPWPAMAQLLGSVRGKGVPLADAELDKLMQDLKSPNMFVGRDAAERLATATPSADRRTEIAQALEGL